MIGIRTHATGATLRAGGSNVTITLDTAAALTAALGQPTGIEGEWEWWDHPTVEIELEPEAPADTGPEVTLALEEPAPASPDVVAALTKEATTGPTRNPRPKKAAKKAPAKKAPAKKTAK